MVMLQLSDVPKDLVSISAHYGSTIAFHQNEDMAMWAPLVSVLVMDFSCMGEFDGATGPQLARRRIIGHCVVGVSLCHQTATAMVEV